jgi:hypothetical protein
VLRRIYVGFTFVPFGLDPAADRRLQSKRQVYRLRGCRWNSRSAQSGQ